MTAECVGDADSRYLSELQETEMDEDTKELHLYSG